MRPEFQKTKAGSTPRYMLGTACIVAFASALLTSERAAAQDAVRPSIAGAEVSAARAQPVFIPENYNLKIGQVQLKLGGSVTAEYNDNINLVRKGQLSDFIISPALTLDAALPITKLNTFHLTLGVGFSKYLEHSAYDTQAITVTPNSQLSYDIYIGGSVRLTLKDQFSLTQDPTTQASLNNVVNFQIFQNDVGATAVWDLNKLILTLGYSHLTEISLTSAFSYLNNNAEVLQSSVAVPLTEAIQVGLDVDGSYTQYEQNVKPSGENYNAGPFMEMTISRFLNLRVAGGYQGLSFDNSSSALANKVNNASDTSDLNSYYANLTLAHRLNRFVTETLAAGRETQSGLQTNYQITDYVRYTANVRMLRDITTGFTFFYDHDTLSSRANPETIDRYGAGVNVSYQLTRKASVSAGYQFIIKDSSLIDNSYNQNRFFLSVHSDF